MICSTYSSKINNYAILFRELYSYFSIASDHCSFLFLLSLFGAEFKEFFACPLQETSAFALSSGVGAANALVFEIVMTFGLVYTVYATAVDPKKGDIGIIAPIAIGFIVGANILAGGAFDGASMNPAVSFGPAVVSWTWDNHWVYWLGPFIGSAIAAIVYEIFFINQNTHEQLPTTDY